MSFTKKYNDHIVRLDKLKVKQNKLSKEMQVAYDYKDDLISKIKFADDQIKNKQVGYHKILLEIQGEIEKLKSEFDLHVTELNIH